MENLLVRGYMFWMDNYHHSPELAWFLKIKETDCVSTLIYNRKFVPNLVKEKKLQKGEYFEQHSGDVTVLAWRDKKRVTVLSTYHNDDEIVSSLIGRKS